MNLDDRFISWLIHYPECWDISAYPTQWHAFKEMIVDFEKFSAIPPAVIQDGWCCQNPDCPYRPAENIK